MRSQGILGLCFRIWVSGLFVGVSPSSILWFISQDMSALICLWICIPGLPWWPSSRRIYLPMQECGFDPWVGKIPWRRKWQPTPVFLPGESHGQRSLAGCSPWGCKRVRHNLATKQQMPACGMPVGLCANVAGIEVYDVCGKCPWMLFLWNTCVYLSLCGFWSFCEYVTGCEVWSFGACIS